MATNIETLELQILANSTSAKLGIDALTSSLKKLKTATSGGLGLDGVSSEISDLDKALSQIKNTNNKATSSFTDLFHKVTVGAKSIKSIAKTIKSAIEKSSDYTETLNLFTVSMGKYAGTSKEIKEEIRAAIGKDTAEWKGALQYAEEVSEAMGIDTKEWMEAQGIFMTLATGFGVASGRAAVMSKNLTQLSYDLASFYNMKSPEEAFLKLKSGLAGELEPLRAIGYDLSQAKLEATALELGITKAVSAMTQAEKAELRYYAIMTQVTQTHGDMARTLDDPANQIRVLKAEINMAAREIGNLFIPALNAMLPYAIAGAKVIGYLASSIASLFGAKKESVETATDNVMENTSSLADNLAESQKEAKKLKSYMLGIDELNVINPNADSEDGSSFSFDLPDYDFMEKLAESRVATIVEEMKEWLGITEDIDTWAELLETRFGKILAIVTAIGIAFGTWKIGAGILALIEAIKTSGVFTALSTALGAISGTTVATVAAVVVAVLAIVAGLAAVYKTNDEVRESVDEAIDGIKKSLTPLLEFLSDTVIPNLKDAWDDFIEMLTPFAEWLKMAFTSIWNDMLIPILNYLGDDIIPNVVSGFMRLWNNVLVPFGGFLKTTFTPIIEWLCSAFTFLWQNIVIPLANAVGGAFKLAWESVVTVVRDGVFPILEGLITFLKGAFSLDWEKAWEGLGTVVEGIWNAIVGIVKGVGHTMVSLFVGVINVVIDAINKLLAVSLDVPEWLGGGTFTLGVQIPKIPIPTFAEGGFPEQGQMFIAREAGAEMVGSIGRKTAVANNDQIVGGIASGVASANEEQNVLLREQNSLLRAILEKDSGVYLDGKNLTNSVEKYQRERGRVLVTGGVI